MTWSGKTAAPTVDTLDRTAEEPLWSEDFSAPLDTVSVIDTLDRTDEEPLWSEAILLVEGAEFDLQFIPPSNSLPYLDVPRLDPAPGSVDVPPGSPLLVAAEDVVPTTQYPVDFALLEESHPAIPPTGLDDSLTLIRVDSGSGYVTVYKDGNQQSGWTVSKVTNADNGFDYTLSYPLLPAASLITVETTVFDQCGNFLRCYSYSFETGFYANLVVPTAPFSIPYEPLVSGRTHR